MDGRDEIRTEGKGYIQNQDIENVIVSAVEG